MKKALTDKQKKFVEEYLVDLNATQAAIRAGYKKNTARKTGSENLTKPDIQIAIQKARNKLSCKTEITQERVLAEYAKIAFFDPKKLFNDDGSLKQVCEMDDETASVISSFEVATKIVKADKKDASESISHIESVTSKVKLVDKKGALDSISRHLGMFNDKLKVSGTVGHEVKREVVRNILKEIDGSTRGLQNKTR